ncbi:TIGR03936 family radical SAM-associated protein [Carboxydothermus ferrireducens]|uniref:Radical SAM-linked protein n=1 Tax=Carboxydothermus ferrireducens DSM 11255 TaxID=1119529 RepID=A0ABX2R9L5_9THEO|nr:TIGR03936 family radical SAM-associated protein [Carboxydothermus ferrireducens]NYE57247.1 radical SAM-linked protein [Carboxydothermus ferrireducens DSM 11255]
MKYLLKYSRGGELKYISHLDTMRVFERAFRRANLPMAFSEGFNPHPKFSIALPLALGHESQGELMELTLKQFLPPEEIKERLNSVLPSGFKVLEVKPYLDDKSLMSRVSKVVYRIKINLSNTELLARKEKLLTDKPRIVKNTKRGEKQIDFWQAVEALEVQENGIKVVIRVGENSLRPEEVAKIFLGYLPEDIEYIREEIILS